MTDYEMILLSMMKGDALYGDIFHEERRYTHLLLESGRLEKVEKGFDFGTGLRLITPWKTLYASTNSSDENDLATLSAGLARFEKKSEQKEVSLYERKTAKYPFSIERKPESVATEDKVAMVRRVDTLIRKMDNRIKQVRVVYRDTRQDVRIVNSDGVNIDDQRTQVVLAILLVGEKDGEMQSSYEAIGGFSGFEFFSDEIIDDVCNKTVKRLAGLLSAREAPTGVKTVVLASEAGGTMIHEAIGHGLEADLALEGLSCYKEMLGEQIASPDVSVVDDGTLPGMRGTYAYDDEGCQSQRTVLVETGILKNYLFDRFSALKHGKTLTGNGRRESFRHKPIPRMSNTMILPGKDSPDQIIASVDDGVLVVKMGGGQVDTVRGDFLFEIAEGYIISQGTVGEMIKNATMMGNGLAVLKGIDMVGNDLGFGIGTCGKDGQGVPVSDAQPTLRIPEIIVGGKPE